MNTNSFTKGNEGNEEPSFNREIHKIDFPSPPPVSCPARDEHLVFCGREIAKHETLSAAEPQPSLG